MAFMTWMASGALRLTGADRLDFLHGQTSNDVKGLPTPGGMRSLILNARGQIEFDVRVFRRADDLYVQTHANVSADVMARLQRYIVFDDVKLEDITDKIRVLHVSGSDSSEIISGFGVDAGGLNVQLLETDAGTILAARVGRGNGDGFDLHVLSSKAERLKQMLETRLVKHLSPADLEQARVLAGLADAHADGFLGLLPQECGLESGVSYRKGCYIGQEIMARLEARGHTNRELVWVRTRQALEAGAELEQSGRSVGRAGHFVAVTDGFLALAVVRKDALGEVQCGGVHAHIERALTAYGFR
jgi:folate-binding protein YgfZ